ncbi:hypothetical protein SAMN05660662_0139 [Blastococcus aurantiacus]|uniref:Uncharacterized protein n=1 Tax=Blastococcus aurantiacus TaxID=1550231 RepID=A0A1G7R3T6_9ACTN|nr:hypothetical protein [Blastococcus aurantiacus]SDG04779.1 hypothetical protein SAMN05660662_0139 [Blastococcus aurantiacus]
MAEWWTLDEGPKQTAELFSPLDPDDDEMPTYIGGELEKPWRLANSFLLAADTLADAWRVAVQQDGREPETALPIIHNYRHAIELSLKSHCLRTRNLLRFGGSMGIGTDAAPANLEKQLNTHSIAGLVKILESLLEGFAVGEEGRRLPEQTARILTYLHDLDAGGMAFRYATQPVRGSKMLEWEPIRPEPTPIYLGSAMTRLHGAAQMLAWGVDGYLDAYEDHLQDRWREYQQNMEDYGP